MGSHFETYILNNGILIPKIGFGTFKIEDGDPVRVAVRTALESGYRHIDTASMYGNEKGIGAAVRESGIPRERIFLTSKLWNDAHGFEPALQAFDDTLRRLGTDYLDLYLIHWPKDKNTETWQALIKLYEEQRVRAIGVSNFAIRHLQEIIDESGVVPMVNQVELHPHLNQMELRSYCERRNIVIESWAPLMRGRFADEPLLEESAQRHGVTIAQVILRWHYQLGLVSLPKSIDPQRIRQNRQIYEFSLTNDEMERIAGLEQYRIGPDPDRLTS